MGEKEKMRDRERVGERNRNRWRETLGYKNQILNHSL